MKNHHTVKYACYTANASMSVVAAISPLLFLTFHNLYGISFLQLGALVLINFTTQLMIDLILSFYSHKFNTSRMVKVTPSLTALGLLVYAIFPYLFPQSVYIGLVIGTIIFASSGGLAEVLISPVIAELPSDNPEREMSKLHSIYAWGVVVVVIFSTLFLRIFGNENWQILALLWVSVPLFSCFLFSRCKVPHLKTLETASNVMDLVKNKEFQLCFFGILLGGASECTMAQWNSSYLEQAFQIPKVWGDIFGVAMFSVMLGLGRTLYSKYGKNIYKLLCISAMSATVCYVIAVVSTSPMVGVIACAFTGLATAMLWPGSLIAAVDQFPKAGVAIFALMAAGGDLGAAIGPQMVGAITDYVLSSDQASVMARDWNMTIEQLSMKSGLLSAIIFPLCATILFAVMYHRRKMVKND
ncbi:MAG: MFS transporter [Eubacteriales bacterium]